MKLKRLTYRLIIVLSLCLMQTAGTSAFAQDGPRAALRRNTLQPDTLGTGVKKTLPETKEQTDGELTDEKSKADSIAAENRRRMMKMTAMPKLEEVPLLPSDSLATNLNTQKWVPNPVKATWLALVIPGGGQIYNKKYWKLPIFYGGFAGCAYALTWNGKMYKDYSNAYRDAVNENWGSTNITDLLPPGYINRVSKTQLTETLRKRKDTYRRYRDMSIFAFIAVYMLSVVDAYVDAELSNFDISDDLSMRVEPAIIGQPRHQGYDPNRKSVGVQCSIRF
ncbi:MAG: hypothetical protein IJ511_08250 [Bacteroides sp.]|nr:hypothetical protein [Bacteroides sp.]